MTTNTNDGDTIDELLLRHLDVSALPEAAKDLVLAALLGEAELHAVLGGAAPARPQPPTGDAGPAEPIGTYLTSIEVAGFRGIGPTATLDLVPGPGLTIVTGRNGSGKSSFAEAAEFALTRDNKRWAGRSAVWQDGWRNLHAAGGSSIRVRLGVEGHRNGATVECHWDAGADFGDRTAFLQLAGQRRQSVAELGWDKALELYRPFLSYSELGGLLSGRPSVIHDSLRAVLGLERLVEVEAMLKAARREVNDRRKRAGERLPALRAMLRDHPDARASQAEKVLAGKVADLHRLEGLATTDEPADDTASLPLRQLAMLQLPSREDLAGHVGRLHHALRQISELAGTPVEEARALAGLLDEALRHHRDHPDQPCPVCGGRTLDQAWAERAQAERQRLIQRAEQLGAAHRVERVARRALRDCVPALPSVLTLDLTAVGVDTTEARLAWQHWNDLVDSGDAREIADTAVAAFEVLDTAVHPVQATAREVLEGRRRAWQPVADQIREWVAAERASRQANTTYAALRRAITWLESVSNQIRNEKLAPIAVEATDIWKRLRCESNVDLDAIRLAGTGPTRRVALNVTVDGEPGSALAVMSQGELHSLALSLFLPRATMQQSPFRFLVIDDPVQSMDPAKVHGLAEVLDEVAKHRQVVVFTHDDRLPTAVRRLGLKAHIRIVSRLARSRVLVADGKDGDPARRYLDDAWAIARDDEMDDKVRGPVICSLVRDAIEYTCHELIRARDLRHGIPIADTEDAINAIHRLRPLLALALLGNTQRAGDLPQVLDGVHPAANRVVDAANKGTHGGGSASFTQLVREAQQVVEGLSRK